MNEAGQASEELLIVTPLVRLAGRVECSESARQIARGHIVTAQERVRIAAEVSALERDFLQSLLRGRHAVREITTPIEQAAAPDFHLAPQRYACLRWQARQQCFNPIEQRRRFVQLLPGEL